MTKTISNQSYKWEIKLSDMEVKDAKLSMLTITPDTGPRKAGETKYQANAVLAERKASSADSRLLEGESLWSPLGSKITGQVTVQTNLVKEHPTIEHVRIVGDQGREHFIGRPVIDCIRSTPGVIKLQFTAEP